MKNNIIDVNSLEIFRTPHYIKNDIGWNKNVLINKNAYLSIIVTNKCQMKCFYCINSKTDQSLDLPIELAIDNINLLIDKYNIEEAILLGGEPLLHPEIFNLIKRLRTETKLKIIRLTTNGIKLKNNASFIKKLVDPQYGIQGINISFHNEEFMTLQELKECYSYIKKYNSDIKVRLNTNIWKNNLDTIESLLSFLNETTFVDEIRVSNIIPKDSFSVNDVNVKNELILTDLKYEKLFTKIMNYYSSEYTIINNDDTLGFVRYVLIPTFRPIVINWNINSTVAEQICENDLSDIKINTFKCLVSGDISLSWNETNIINLQKHLCISCYREFATCKGNPKFGNGKGNDNVIECKEYLKHTFNT